MDSTVPVCAPYYKLLIQGARFVKLLSGGIKDSGSCLSYECRYIPAEGSGYLSSDGRSLEVIDTTMLSRSNSFS